MSSKTPFQLQFGPTQSFDETWSFEKVQQENNSSAKNECIPSQGENHFVLNESLGFVLHIKLNGKKYGFDLC